MVARILMDVWADLLHHNLERNNIVVYLLTKYVDDINVALAPIPKGFYWDKTEGKAWKLTWTQETEELDKERGSSDEERTLELVRELCNSLVPGLRLTKDLPEYHESKKCPMLDIQVWVQDGKCSKVIRHTFYQKPTTSP